MVSINLDQVPDSINPEQDSDQSGLDSIRIKVTINLNRVMTNLDQDLDQYQSRKWSVKNHDKVPGSSYPEEDSDQSGSG